MNSLLQLDSYFYILNSIAPNPHFKNNESYVFEKNISAIVQEDKDNINCAVTLEINPSMEGNFPYSGIIKIYGIFKISKELSRDDAITLVKKNAAIILIGALREKLRSETSSGPFPALFLPPIDVSQINF